MNFGYWSKSISWKYFVFHEMTLKLYFMKCPERKISQCILPFRKPVKQPSFGKKSSDVQNLTRTIFLQFKWGHRNIKQKVQKQPSRGVLNRRFSENMLQIYRRTPTPIVAVRLYWNHTLAWVFSYKFDAYFQNTFS